MKTLLRPFPEALPIPCNAADQQRHDGRENKRSPILRINYITTAKVVHTHVRDLFSSKRYVAGRHVCAYTHAQARDTSARVLFWYLF